MNAASPLTYVGPGCGLTAQRQTAIDSLRRSLRRCARYFERAASRELLAIAANELGLPETEATGATARQPVLPARPPGLRAASRLPRRGEAEALRDRQGRAAERADGLYSELTEQLEELNALECDARRMGLQPAHRAIGPRLWRLMRLLAEHGTLAPYGAWYADHERWAAGLGDEGHDP